MPHVYSQLLALWFGLRNTGKGCIEKLLTNLLGKEYIQSPTTEGLTTAQAGMGMADRQNAFLLSCILKQSRLAFFQVIGKPW